MTPAPATDIVVLSGSQLRNLEDTRESLKVLRVTDRPEYDNQPSFLPSGDLLFTAASDDGTTDIHRFEFDSDHTGGSSDVVSDLEQSLYSPTPIPGENAISIVRDYGNQVQQLWRVPLDGGPPTALLTEINPIGYHAWMADGGLLLFVLGDPPTLQTAAIGAKSGEVLGPEPGRCLARIPTSAFGPDAMSYVHVGSSVPTDSGAPIMALAPDGATRVVTEGRPGSQDYAWAPDGSLWMGEGSDLYTWTRTTGWRRVAQLAPLGLSGISRMAWSHDGSRLALVVEHPAPSEAP